MASQPVLGVPLTRLKARTSVKWRRYPADVLPLWVAEMDAEVPPGVATAIAQAVTGGDLGYPFGVAYQQAFADFARDMWGWVLDPVANARLAPDVLTGIRLLIQAVTALGDGVVINPPVYPPFFALPGVAGRRTVEVPLKDDRLDLAGLEAAFAAPDVTAFLLCSPHNPTSTIHTRDELAAVAELAENHGVTVIADEIHAPFAGSAHVPWPTVDPRGLVVTSSSKSWNLAALKASLLLAGPEATAVIAGLSPFETEFAVSHLAVIAHTAALRHDREWLARVRAEVAGNRELVARLLAENLPGVRYTPRDGTYLAWLDCTGLGLDDPAATFEHDARVALNAGSAFGSAYGRFVRMNLATSPVILTEAVERMGAARG